MKIFSFKVAFFALALAFGALFSSLNSEIVAGVAVRVNSHAITMQEIANAQKEMRLSRAEAVDFLINERLKDDEIERFKINIDEFKIDDEIERIAQSSGVSKNAIIAQASRQGLSYQEYRAEIKKQLQTRELMQKILASNISVTDENELFKYYNAHRKDFEMPDSVVATRYSASSEELLRKAMADRKKEIAGVKKENERIDIQLLPPHIAQIFAQAQMNRFTPILNAGDNTLVAFLIQERHGVRTLSFEEARGMVMQMIAQNKEQEIIKEHFERVKLSAKIVYVR